MKKNNASFRIVFLDASTVDLGDLDLIGLEREGRLVAYPLSEQAEIASRAAVAQVIVTNKCVLGEAQFAALPELKLVCVAATGVNNIDLIAAKHRGIAVANVARYSTSSVAEHALLLMLAVGHRLMPHAAVATDGAWSASPHFAVLDFPFKELRGKTLGILGYGAIGKAVGRLAKGFGMKVLVAKLPGRAYGVRDRHLPLRRVLEKSDYVSLHCALSETTRHLINRERLSMMKAGAVLLNLARGAVVNEVDVADALKTERLAAYASDVLSAEPPPADHPLLDPAVRDKVLLTPHVAWASLESRERLIAEIAANIRAFKQGKRRNRVV